MVKKSQYFRGIYVHVILLFYLIVIINKLAKGWWFFPGIPVSSTHKTDRHDITEILLKVALNTITLTY
jgi:hypothetical protein